MGPPTLQGGPMAAQFVDKVGPGLTQFAPLLPENHSQLNRKSS